MNNREYITQEDLPVKFSNEEKIALSEELAEAIDKKARLENQIKEFADLRKPGIKSADSQIEFQSSLIVRGYQLKSVDCRVIIDYKTCKKTTVRIDTGELVREEQLKDDELQTSLLDSVSDDDAEIEAPRQSKKMRQVI